MLDVAGYFLALPCPALSTAAAMVEEISDIRPMVSPISLMAPTESCVAGLDSADLLTDLAGRLRGLLGQSFHLRRHDRESRGRLHQPAPPRSWHSGPADWSVPQLVLISSTTSPMRAAAFDNSPTRSLVFLRLIHRLVGDPGTIPGPGG